MQPAWATTLKLLGFALLLVGWRWSLPVILGLAAALGLLALILDVFESRRGARPRWLIVGPLLVASTVVLFAVNRPGLPSVPALDVPEFGFRLRSPGTGWVLLSKADLPTPPHAPDVRAGAETAEGVMGVVIVLPTSQLWPDPSTPPDLDILATRHKATVDWSDRQELDYRRLTCCGHDARRYQVRGRDGGGVARVGQATLFVAGERVYIIAAVGYDDAARPADPRFSQFEQAVELLPTR